MSHAYDPEAHARWHRQTCPDPACPGHAVQHPDARETLRRANLAHAEAIVLNRPHYADLHPERV